jgi:hypothetical protein
MVGDFVRYVGKRGAREYLLYQLGGEITWVEWGSDQDVGSGQLLLENAVRAFFVAGYLGNNCSTLYGIDQFEILR